MPQAAFSCIHSENQKQKTEQKDLQNFQFGQKRSLGEADAKGNVVAEEINTFNNTPSTVHWDKKRACQEPASFYPFLAQGDARVNFLGRLSIGPKFPKSLIHFEPLKEVLTPFQSNKHSRVMLFILFGH